MPGDAAIAGTDLDLLLDSPATDFPLFAPPREPVALGDYAAGLHAASLVPDGGTLQIGIGSLGEAVAQRAGAAPEAATTSFARCCHASVTIRRAIWLFMPSVSISASMAARELFVEGMLDLFRAGILKREVDGIVLHAGFFIGSRDFYRSLREMPPETAAKFGMTGDFVRQRALSRRRQQASRAGQRPLPQRCDDGDRAW